MNEADLLAELASLPSKTGYTAGDRFHDFRRLFTGSEEGKRVLREILSWGHLLQPSVFSSPVDPYLTHIREGEANIARKLLVTVMIEPPDKPLTQTRKQKR